MNVVLGVLWVISAALPLFGLCGLWRTATSESDEWAKAPPSTTGDPDRPTHGQTMVLLRILQKNVRTRPNAVRRDFLLVGVGVIIGLAADLLSLTT